jgi:molecular chaperone HtpG
MKFQAKIYQLMNSTINAFYGNKEIFLWELISNCSYICDKIIYESLKNSKVVWEQKQPNIDIVSDKESKHIVVKDTGIGMVRAQLISNLRTISRSGTRQFM